MKRVKFTLGLMLSFLLMGASVAHADIYIPAGSNIQTVLSTKTPAQIGVIFAGCTYQGAVSGDQDTIVGTPTVLLFNGGAAMSGLTTSDIEQLISLTDAAGSDFTVNLAGFSALTSLNVSGATHLTAINNTGSTSLETLNVSNTGIVSLAYLPTTLTELDASNCSALNALNCSTATALETLNLTGSDALANLSISNTQVKNLDLSGKVALSNLTLNAVIETLDVTGCAGLTSLTASGSTELTSVKASGCTTLADLDLSGDTKLETLNVTNCPLGGTTGLDVSGCTLLTSIEGIAPNVTITTLNIANTGITDLNVAGDTNLTSLDVTNCKLTKLNISGTKVNLNNISGIAESEKTLVSVDASNTEPSSLMINTANFEKLESLNVSGSNVTSLTATTKNKTLKNLNVTNCADLTDLYCNDNQLTALDLTGCDALSILDCSNNNISELDISGNTLLGNITIGQNVDFKVTIVPGQAGLYGIEFGTRNENLKDVIGDPDITAKEYHSITMIGDDVYGGLVVDNKALADYRVTIGGKNRAPGYQLSSVTVYNEDGTEVTVDREGFGTINASGSFIMPNNAVTVYYKYERIPNPDWYNITVDEKDKEGNTTTGGIDVPGKAQEGAIVTIKPHFTFDPNTDGHTNSDPNSANYPIQVIDSEGKRVALTALGDGSFTFIMPYHNVTVSFTSATSNGETGFPDPVVYRTVQIISNGLETLPKATNGSNGYHYVAGHQDFKFTVISSNPINVTTNRKNNVLGDAIIVVDNGDGTWSVTIRQVTTNLIVTVSDATTESGTGENGTTGNEAIAKDAVWAANGTLYVRTATPGFMAIYNVTGQLCKQVAVSGDATFTLSRGIYIVQLNGKAYKVVL